MALKRTVLLVLLVLLGGYAGAASSFYACAPEGHGCLHVDAAEGHELIGEMAPCMNCSACAPAVFGQSELSPPAPHRCARLDRLHTGWLDGPDPFPPKRLARP